MYHFMMIISGYETYGRTHQFNKQKNTKSYTIYTKWENSNRMWKTYTNEETWL